MVIDGRHTFRARQTNRDRFCLGGTVSVEPDYRYTLANERTYLAWIRTALGLIAGGIALQSFAGELDPSWLARLAGIGFTALGGVLTIVAYRQWLRVQRAMRSGDPLPVQRAAVVLTVGVVILAAVLSIGLLVL